MASDNSNFNGSGDSTGVTFKLIPIEEYKREKALAEAFWREERKKKRQYDKRFIQGVHIAPLGNIRRLIDHRADDNNFLAKFRIKPL